MPILYQDIEQEAIDSGLLEPVYLVSFSRNSEGFHEELQEGPKFAPMLDALQQAGLRNVLECGAKIICKVEQHAAVRSVTERSKHNIRGTHVLVTETYKNDLMEAVQSSQGTSSVRVKSWRELGLVPSGKVLFPMPGRDATADDGAERFMDKEFWDNLASQIPRREDQASEATSKDPARTASVAGGTDDLSGSSSGGTSSDSEPGQLSPEQRIVGGGSPKKRGDGASSRETESTRLPKDGHSAPSSATSAVISPDAEATGGSGANNEVEPLYMISFSRYPAELHNALQTDPNLVPIREALRDAGHSCEVCMGAKLYCRPDQFDAVRSLIRSDDNEVRPYHVLVTQSCRSVLGHTIWRLLCRGRKGVRMKREVVMGYVPLSKFPPLELPPTDPNSDARASKTGSSESNTSRTRSRADSHSFGEPDRAAWSAAPPTIRPQQSLPRGAGYPGGAPPQPPPGYFPDRPLPTSYPSAPAFSGGPPPVDPQMLAAMRFIEQLDGSTLAQPTAEMDPHARVLMTGIGMMLDAYYSHQKDLNQVDSSTVPTAPHFVGSSTATAAPPQAPHFPASNQAIWSGLTNPGMGPPNPAIYRDMALGQGQHGARAPPGLGRNLR